MSAARKPYLEDDGVPPPGGAQADDLMQWPGSELLHSALFRDVRQERLERRLILSPADYLGYLSTVSAYLQLPHDVRQAALSAISAVLPSRVHVTADIWLHLARRDDPAA